MFDDFDVGADYSLAGGGGGFGGGSEYSFGNWYDSPEGFSDLVGPLQGYSPLSQSETYDYSNYDYASPVGS